MHHQVFEKENETLNIGAKPELRRRLQLRQRTLQPLASTGLLPEIPLPLLITGVAGVAGYNAFHAYRQRYGDRVIGQRPVNNWPLIANGIVGCDLEDEESVAALIRQYRFRSVLSCGGSCALKSCELDPEMARRVNVVAIENLLNALDGHENRLVHLSIDLVFSGAGNGWQLESDPADPVTVYGQTMADGEQLVLCRRPDSAVLRISLPMGPSFNGHAGAIDWIQSRFKAGRPATLYFDEIRTPTYVECMNRVLADVLANQINGLYHCGGKRGVTLFQIAQIVNRVGGYDPHLLHGCPRIEAGPIPPRAGDVTMNSERLSSVLGYEPFVRWPADNKYFPTSRIWHFEGASDWQGSRELLRDVLYNRFKA